MAERENPGQGVVLVGAIAGAFGVRGEVKIKSFTQIPEDVFDYAPFRDAAGTVILNVESWRHVKGGFAAYSVEVTNRDEAVALKSTQLFADKSVLPELAEDEFYHADLIGLPVVTLDETALGRVKAIHNFGADDLLELAGTPGVRKSWYLPFTKAVVVHIDLDKGELVANPPEALLPGGEDDEQDHHNPKRG